MVPEIPLNIPIIAYGGEQEEYLKESVLNRYECITNHDSLDKMKVHDFTIFHFKKFEFSNSTKIQTFIFN